ncbi:MAG: hypothetical protein ACT4OI_05275 [Methanobacteriota archaeon]
MDTASRHPRRAFDALLRDRLAPVYAAGVVGAFLQVAGGYWDISWHVLGIVETFFTPPHAILYAGILLAGLAGVAGLAMRVAAFRADPVRRRLLTGLHVAVVGTAIQAAAGPADFWWHERFGFDPFLFTPPHALLIGGIVLSTLGVAIGSARLLQARRAGLDVGRPLGDARTVAAVAATGLAVMWIGFNGLIYLLADLQGVEYTFRLPATFSDRYDVVALVARTTALAFAGTLVLLAARRLFPRWGGVAAVAGVSAVITVLPNLTFRAIVGQGTPAGTAIAWFVPLYVSFLIPVVLFGRFAKAADGRGRTLVASVLVSPFASFLDGWNSLGLWLDARDAIPVLLVPIGLAGLAAGLLQARFERILLARGAAVGA